MKLIDRRGERYERLLVLERAPNASSTDNNARWNCRCDCGRSVVAYGQDLKKGKIKSCGCLSASRMFKHGMANTLLNRVWIEMRSRCRNPKHPSYKNYGGRGIDVCPEWADFSVFYADMGEPPKGGTIERIDNNGPYSKANCRWATYKEQLRNRRITRMLTVNGVTKPFAQWADECGIPWTTLRSRIERYGWPLEQAVTRKRQPGKRLEKT